MDIKPRDQTIKNLLESGFYRIPRFQRPYSWDRENVAEFWNDAVVADSPAYFIGSFVLHTERQRPDVYNVVDGQQRLTTITLLLAAVRDVLDAQGFNDQAVGVQKLIERADLNNELQFVLQSETPYPYLQEQIQKHGKLEVAGELGAEEKALEAAFVFLKGQVSQAVAAISEDTTLSAEKRKDKIRTKLLEVRDRLLRLQLIAIQLGTEDDAYLIFETLNTRGKDLSVSDLVKNHLTRLLKPTHKGVDRSKDKWNRVLATLEGSEAEIDVNRFLHHSWLSRNAYTTEKLLFKEVKKAVLKTNAAAFLESLVEDAQTYRYVLEPSSRRWTKQERPIIQSLIALASFRVVQPVPMLLSIIRAYDKSALSLKQTIGLLCSMEDFHVQFTAVTNQRTGGGTAFMYALGARELTPGNQKDKNGQVIKAFKQKLRDRIPSYEEFEAGMLDIRFSNENTRQRQLVRYLLRRVDEHLRTGVRPDYEQMTVEHLASQNPSGAAEASEDVIGMLGNLLLVPQELNEGLKNLPVKVGFPRFPGHRPKLSLFPFHSPQGSDIRA